MNYHTWQAPISDDIELHRAARAYVAYCFGSDATSRRKAWEHVNFLTSRIHDVTGQASAARSALEHALFLAMYEQTMLKSSATESINKTRWAIVCAAIVAAGVTFVATYFYYEDLLHQVVDRLQ